MDDEMDDENWIIWRQFRKFMKNFWRISISVRSICQVNILQFTKNDGTILRPLSFQGLYAKKPTKYGIKVYGLVHVTSNYFFNSEIYAGQQPEGIIRMIDPIRNSGRTITTDNYFTSLLPFRAIIEHGLQLEL